MSGRTLLSRPRTRIYDANYNMSENYYRPALDRLDRKYGGRPLSEPRHLSPPADLLERHERAFADEDLNASRRRAEKHITESHLFDSRGGRIAQRALDLAENDIDEETAASLRRIRAQKKAIFQDDIDLESTVSSINSRRMLHHSDKLLESVGIGRGARSEEAAARRTLRVSAERCAGEPMVRWSPLVREDGESAAAGRARQSKDRLSDLADEMAELAERQAVRERRAVRLRQLVAETAEETRETQNAVQAVSVRRSRQARTVEE